jgi:hypothetical protein
MKKPTYSLLRFWFLLMFLPACNLALGGVATPMPTPDLPRVQFLAPANNQQVLEGADFDLDILAQDERLGIAKLDLYVDGTLVNSAIPQDGIPVPAFRATMNWLAQGLGFHAIEAVAYRADGTRGDAALLTLEVIPAPPAP